MAGGPQARFAPKERAKDAKGTLLKLFAFYAKEGKSLFVVSALLLLAAGINVLSPFLIGKGVNAIAEEAGVNFTTAYKCAAALLAVCASVLLINITQGLIMNVTSQRIVRRLRKTLFDKFQKLPLTYHDAHTHGELMSRLTNDIDNISATIAQSTTELISAVITLAGSIGMMLYLSPPLTLIAMITAPLVILLTSLIAKRSKAMFVGQQRELGKLNGLIEETITGRKMVKAFGMEDRIVGAFAANNAQMKYYSVRAQIWSGLLMPFMNVITNIGYVSVVFAGGVMAVSGGVAVGTVASFITYSRQFTYPLNNIAGMFNSLQSALAGAERVFEVLSQADEPEDLPDAIDLSAPKGAVEFKNVTFAYTEGVNVLKDVSFTVQPGQKVALVGETGAGKTTIVNLLTRFYDATSGTVLIDGRDIKSYKRSSLRSAFSVVLQDTCLFSGTIADNIRYAVPEASEADIEEAAKDANAHPFIMRLKNGYDTQVSGETDSLSQGQRQLLAISRAVLCRAPILVLDEATSSVDTRTESRIQEALIRLSEGRTTFVIAHRLSTVRDADVIMVVREGRIAESGSHEELLKSGGLYAQMYNHGYGEAEAESETESETKNEAKTA